MASCGVIPGAGSSGLVWREALAALDATLLPVPDEPDVPAMAAALRAEVERLGEPRVLVGASLGAMVALELARALDVQALVLIATGFGIEVSDALLHWVADAPPDLFPKMARASIADRDNAAMVEVVTRDFEARGPRVALRHLRALAAYSPEPLPTPPRTVVIWGERDHSVPLADHVELAIRCRGALVPIAGAGHMPFFERPSQTAHWIQTAARLAHEVEENPHGSHDGPFHLPDLA
jgi:pimeloyl-ACP methyl ester carboxylesterase